MQRKIIIERQRCTNIEQLAHKTKIQKKQTDEWTVEQKTLNRQRERDRERDTERERDRRERKKKFSVFPKFSGTKFSGTKSRELIFGN